MHTVAFTLLLLFRWTYPTEVDISGIDRNLLFRELHKHALSSKRRSLFSPKRKKMGVKTAFKYVGKPVEEVNGIAMNVYIPAEDLGAILDTKKYNDVYGAGAAEKAIGKARSKTLKLRERASKHSPGCCSKWKCDRRGCLLTCLGAGISILVCGVASGLCCSFADVDTTVDDISNLAGGSNDVSGKIAPGTNDISNFMSTNADDNRFSNRQSHGLLESTNGYFRPKDAYFTVNVAGVEANSINRANVPDITTFYGDNNDLPNELLPNPIG